MSKIRIRDERGEILGRISVSSGGVHLVDSTSGANELDLRRYLRFIQDVPPTVKLSRYESDSQERRLWTSESYRFQPGDELYPHAIVESMFQFRLLDGRQLFGEIESDAETTCGRACDLRLLEQYSIEPIR